MRSIRHDLVPSACDSVRAVLVWKVLACAQTLEQEAYEKAKRERNFPEFSSGDVVELKLVRSALHGGSLLQQWWHLT